MPDLFLLHFDPPYRHARHYLGYAVGTGRGAKYARSIARNLTWPHELVLAAQANLCKITVVDVLVGEGRATQRRMRANGSLSHFCHVCHNEGRSH